MRKKTTFFLIGIILCSFQVWAQESRVVNVPTPGTLSTILGTDRDLISDLTVTGSINDADFQTIKQMLLLKNLNIQFVEIANEAIPSYAFQNKIMENIILPNSLKRIGEGAFAEAKLPQLTFTNCTSLTDIAHWAFRNLILEENILDFSSNSNLVNFGSWGGQRGVFSEYTGHVILPASLTNLPECTFHTFKGHITFPENLQKIGKHCFAYSTPSQPLLLPNSVSEIDEGCFKSMEIDRLQLPFSLKKIGIMAFEGIKTPSLFFAHCPELEEIGYWAFRNAELEENTLNFSYNNNLTRFTEWASQRGVFSGYSGHVILPTNMIEIPAFAFYEFNGYVTLPINLQRIGNYAFAYSQPAHELQLPNTMIEIGEGSFMGMTTEKLKFPFSLKKIGNRAFEEIKIPQLLFNTCPELEEIGYWAFRNTGVIELDFSNNYKLNRFLEWGGQRGTFSDYSGHVILPTNMSEIPAFGFYAFKGEVTFPTCLKKIGNYSFAYSNPSHELHLPDSLIELGEGGFLGMETERLLLPSSLKRIGDRSFESTIIPRLFFAHCHNLEEIGYWAFRNIALTENTLNFSYNQKLSRFGEWGGQRGAFSDYNGHVILPINMKELSPFSFYAFKGRVTLPTNLEKIGNYAFALSQPSHDLTVPATLIEIGEGAFQRMVIDHLHFSSTLKKIGDRAFEETTIPQLFFNNCDSLEEIGYWAFRNINLENNTLDFSTNAKLTRFNSWNSQRGVFSGYDGYVILPENMEILPSFTFYAFAGNADLPPNLINIQNNAFSQATIQEIIFPATLQTIGNNAFSGCLQLGEITCNSITPPQLGTNVFNNVDKFNCTLKVPDESVILYSEADQWKDFLNITSRSGTSTDMELNIKELNIEIFPNPIIDIINIGSKETVLSINIYDEKGQLMKTTDNINSPIDVTDLPSGMYLINIQTENNTYTRKIIKK